MTRRTCLIRWASDGHESRTRLFDDQADGTHCVICCLSDDTPDNRLLPVGRISGVGYVVAHTSCNRNGA